LPTLIKQPKVLVESGIRRIGERIKLLTSFVQRIVTRLLEKTAERTGLRKSEKKSSSLLRRRNQTDAEWENEVQAFIKKHSKRLKDMPPNPRRSYPATSKSWDIKPFGRTIEIPYSDNFTAEEYARLKRGLIPEAMEEKWFIYFEDHELHFHRGWTGQGIFRVELQEEESGDASVKRALFATDEAVSDMVHLVELLRFLVGNLLLDRRLPFPRSMSSSEPAPGVIQHSFSGTGYPEKTLDKK